MARAAGGNPELNSYVADALMTRNQSFEELKGLLRECRLRVEQEPNNEEAVMQLSTLIGAMTSNVSAIRERNHESLVSEVLSIKLWTAAPAVLSAVLDFTRNLVVANSAFTHTCLQLLVYSFTPPPASPNPEDPSQDPHGPWRPSEQALAVQQCLLTALSRLLGLVPTAPTNILPLIVSQMPHKLRDRNTQCLYLSALFRIAEDRAGAPIKEALLTAVMEHLLSLDVEIKWEDIADVPTGEEDEEDDGVNEDIFELEGMLASELDINANPEEVAQRQAMLAMRGDGRGGWEGAAGGRQHQQASTRPPVDEMADKMDSMMELAFEHLGKRIAAGELRRLWDTLLSAFERTVLNTHRSKFTQYLVFFACMHNPSHCPASLLRLLLTRLRDARQPPITRAACAAYLASFLARAAFLPESLVVKTLQELSAFCIHYCNSQAGGLSAAGTAISTAAGPSELSDSMPYAGLTSDTAMSLTQRHQVLYAAVQAILYVLCYHMHPIIGSQQQQQQHQAGAAPAAEGAGSTAGTSAPAPAGSSSDAHPGRGTAAERKQLAEALVALVRGPVCQVLNHPQLQPLGACVPSVAMEFVRQTSSLGIVDCRSLLSRQVEPTNRSQRPLEMFFPFDPYLLRRSSRYLQLKKSYVKWRHGHPQAAAAEAEVEAAESDDSEDEGAAEGRAESEDGQGEDLSVSSSEDDSDGDELAGGSVASDAMLHDPTHRLHAGGAMRPRHPHPAARGIHQHPHGRRRGALPALGTSYMSYASAETASHGDGGTSPYGTSPYDGGDMLVQNTLGASPGVVPMSLGTPEMHFISQVPMRIGRK